MNTKWNQIGGIWMRADSGNQFDKLPVGVYRVDTVPSGMLVLNHLYDSFEFSFKLYGKGQNFAERVKRIFDETHENIGILFTGTKGTGKTVDAQLIGNVIKLPVIIIDRALDGLVPFMNSITQDVIFFFDEFEKTFKSDWQHGSALLPIMDGVFRGKNRKLFLLTTNELSIEPNLLSRPGRIRYLKKYGNLDKDTIAEIVDDQLKNKKYRQELLMSIAGLDIITVDVVMHMVQEVNIFDEEPRTFLPFFNVKAANPNLHIYKLETNKETNKLEETLYRANARTSPAIIDETALHHYFQVNGRNLGEIVEIKEDGHFVVKRTTYDEQDNEVENFDQYRTEKVPSFHYVC